MGEQGENTAILRRQFIIRRGHIPGNSKRHTYILTPCCRVSAGAPAQAAGIKEQGRFNIYSLEKQTGRQQRAGIILPDTRR